LSSPALGCGYAAASLVLDFVGTIAGIWRPALGLRVRGLVEDRETVLKLNSLVACESDAVGNKGRRADITGKVRGRTYTLKRASL